MARKPRRNRSNHHEPRRPQPVPARAVLEKLLAEAKIERKTQAAVMQELVRKHHGDVPVRAIWDHLADRREAAITGGAM